MRPRYFVSIMTLFISAGLALALFLLGSNLFERFAGAETHFQYNEPPSQSVNPISRENTHQGTISWQIPPGKEATVEIQAYASATSVAPERWITFYVSTLKNGTPYFLDVYRIGWYAGYGGRLMFQSTEQKGQAQGYYDSTTHLRALATPRLIGCTTCYVDNKKGLVEANWSPSYKLYVPTDWTTGIYLAKFTDAKGKQTYVPFDVLGNYHSLAVAVTPDTTYAAYNNWGGYSLYDADNAVSSSSQPGETDTATSITGLNNQPVRGVNVSFDRPYVQGAGASQVLIYEADAIRWLERQGYDLAYMSDVDLQTNPAQIMGRYVYISLGHDEYWTKEMRDSVEQARNDGVSLAFLGADADYWQMRFESDKQGIANRTIVSYKVDSGLGPIDLARDPLYGKDNSRVTSRWRDPVVGRPENELIGIMFSGLTHLQRGFPWQLATHLTSPLIVGTNLLPNKAYGCGLVGYEWDRVFSNGDTPKGLQILGTSSTENNSNQLDFSNTTYYIANSGAMVFASGSIYWSYALDNYRSSYDNLCYGHDTASPELEQLMQNIMAALVQHAHGGKIHTAAPIVPSPTPTRTARNAFYIPAMSIIWLTMSVRGLIPPLRRKHVHLH